MTIETNQARGNGLIPCATCNNEIGVQSVSCPKCGSPNTWVHPQIQAFIDEKSLDISRPFVYWHKGSVIWGESPYHSVDSWIIAFLIGFVALFSAIFSLFVGPAIGGVILMFFWHGAEKKDTFKADLTTGSWESSNNKLWLPVTEVLGVQRSRSNLDEEELNQAQDKYKRWGKSFTDF